MAGRVWVATSIGHQTGERAVRHVSPTLADLIAYFERSWYVPGGAWHSLEEGTPLNEAHEVGCGADVDCGPIGRDLQAECWGIEVGRLEDVRAVRKALEV